MLKIVVGAGLFLMALGFGAAGWIFYQQYRLPVSVDAPAVAVVAEAPAAPSPPLLAEEKQAWLISPTGGLVPQDKVRAYLVQSRFVPGRSVVITYRAALSQLLTQDETLPATPYLQALADIRAPMLADGLCEVLSASLVTECALHSAKVVKGSVDPVSATALFTLELVFREQTAGIELPDLATHVLRDQAVDLQIATHLPGAESPAAALMAAVDATRQACSLDGAGQVCRVQGIALDWQPGRPVSISASVAWLDPLPAGVFTAPPLGLATGG